MPGRTTSAQPTASPWNIVIASTCSARSASARTAGSAAASSPETIRRPIGSGFASSPSAAAAQASATPRAFGVAGRWKAPQPGLPSRPSRCASSASRAPPPPPRPDQIREGALRFPDRGLERAGELVALRGALHPGAVTARLLEPELDDRGPVGDVVVAQHDDDLRPGDGRKRRTERVEGERGRLGQHGGVRAQPHAQELRERVRLLDRLGAGERSDDPPLGSAQQRLDPVERVVPRELAEAAQPRPLERVDDPVVGVEMREGEAALVAEPALVDLGVVARDDRA